MDAEVRALATPGAGMEAKLADYREKDPAGSQGNPDSPNQGVAIRKTAAEFFPMSDLQERSDREWRQAWRRSRPGKVEEAVLPPAMQDLPAERSALRRKLYRAYRGWLGQLIKEQGDQIPGRNRVIEHLRCWDLRYSEEQTTELATLLLEEVPIAMMAALGRTCRDRRININVRIVLARDYQHYRELAREMVEAGSKIEQELRKQREEKVLAAIRREQELAAAKEQDPIRRGWWQMVQRAWWICRAWLGWKIPQQKLGDLVDLYREGNEEEMMERFYELGGTVEKMEGTCPPWSIDGDVWSEEDGEIWNVEPCFQGGKSIYVGNIFKDPVIRGKTNPEFRGNFSKVI